jgi:8-oxo-dGTP pyrophosphatase MutT (NUDIX family)
MRGQRGKAGSAVGLGVELGLVSGMSPERPAHDPYSLTVRTGIEVAVFVTRKHGSEVLIVHRSPAQGAYWHVVSGGVEPGETASEAAERELREETGLVAKAVAGAEVIEYVYSLTEEPADRRHQYDPSVAQVQVTCFHIAAPDEWEPKLDWEHDDHRWCEPREAYTTLRWPATAEALRKLLLLETN